jgi:hypothetical protein
LLWSRQWGAAVLMRSPGQCGCFRETLPVPAPTQLSPSCYCACHLAWRATLLDSCVVAMVHSLSSHHLHFWRCNQTLASLFLFFGTVPAQHSPTFTHDSPYPPATSTATCHHRAIPLVRLPLPPLYTHIHPLYEPSFIMLVAVVMMRAAI